MRKTWECTVSSVTLSNPAHHHHHHQREKKSVKVIVRGAARWELQPHACRKPPFLTRVFVLVAVSSSLHKGQTVFLVAVGYEKSASHDLKTVPIHSRTDVFPVKTAEFAIPYPLSLLAIAFVATQRAQTLRLEPLRGAGKQNMKVVELENSGIIYPPIIHPSIHASTCAALQRA